MIYSLSPKPQIFDSYRNRVVEYDIDYPFSYGMIFHYKKITEIRFLNSLKDFPCMIFIYGNKVAMYTVKGELVGLIISNKEFAQAMKIMFDVYWGMGKKGKK